ncbi:hypothetical protein DMENIID0001_046490 [Sergentomyia squamirostris]
MQKSPEATPEALTYLSLFNSFTKRWENNLKFHPSTTPDNSHDGEFAQEESLGTIRKHVTMERTRETLCSPTGESSGQRLKDTQRLM